MLGESEGVGGIFGDEVNVVGDGGVGGGVVDFVYCNSGVGGGFDDVGFVDKYL